MVSYALSSPHAVLAQDVLREAVLELQAAHIESASLDARLLLEEVLGVTREQLLLVIDEPVGEAQQESYRALVARRINHEPIAYLLGRREFWDMNFAVTQDTLIPRPDSETVIEAVLERVKNRSNPLKIADLGTGSGCLLLALLKELPQSRGLGLDICPKALTVARENALAHGLSARAEFVQSHWDEKIDSQFDIILSNPPYIPVGERSTLAADVAQYEPHGALFGGEDGLDAYRHIINVLPVLLKDNGFAALEIGYGQSAAIRELVKAGPLHIEAITTDLQGIERCVVITRSK